jgi:uncharacterized protein YyaL (SSP411 family)
MLGTLYKQFLPNRVIAQSDTGGEELPLFEGRAVANGEVKAYVCRNSVCNVPAETVEAFAEQLKQL